MCIYKKYIISSIFIGIVFPTVSYGFRNFLVNGGTSATVTIEDSFTITGEFVSGAAKVVLYYDANANGILDIAEQNYWLKKYKFIDGDFNDKDESPNKIYKTVVDPITFIGNFILYAEDNGISDTVSIKVNPVSSSYSVSGTITNPPNTKNLFVCVLDTINGIEYHYGDFTDEGGKFFISIPNRIGAHTWRCFAVDMLGVTPNFVSSDINSQITVSGAVTQNLSMLPITSFTTIIGDIRDDNNVLIKEPIYIMVGGSDDVRRIRLKSGKSNIGQFSISFQKFSWVCVYGILATGVAAQFYPTFMNPIYDTIVFTPPGAPEQIQFNIKIYRTTNTIKGRVYIDGSPYDGALIECSNPIVGGMYTKSYSDGRYEMPVSDSGSIYTLRISPKSIPHGYRVLESIITASPGDTGKNFHVVGIEERTDNKNQIIKINTGSFVYKISYDGDIENLDIYNIVGIKVMEITPRRGVFEFVLDNIPNGIYFYCINKEKKGKIIKLR